MADAASPRHLSYREAEALVEYTPAYLKRLLIERHLIYGAMLNPGGSVILRGYVKTVETIGGQSSIIGNDFHLDLLEALDALRAMPPEHVAILLSWADGVSDQEAADYRQVPRRTIQTRRRVAAIRAAKAMSNEQDGDGREPGIGTPGDRDAATRS